MSKSINTLFVSLVFLVAVFTGSAQTNTNTITTFHTNLLLNVNLSFTAYIQREFPVSTNRVVEAVDIQHFTSRGVIDGIAAAATGGSNEFAGAQLLFREADFMDSSSTFGFVLRKGTQELVLSNHFTFGGGIGNEIGTQRIGPKGTTNSSDLIILSFSLNTPQASADLQGLARIHGASVILHGKNIAPDPFPASFTASVVGSGFVQNRPAILRGTIVASGRKVEITQGP